MPETVSRAGAAPEGRPRRRDRWFPPVLLFLVALAVRLGYLLSMRGSPYFLYPIMDGQIHDQWAWSIVSGHDPIWAPPFFRAPLYPYFLALVYWIFGHSYTWARVVHALLGSASVALIFAIGRRVFGARTGWIAGLAAAFYWMFLYFEGELLIVTLIVLLDLAALLVLVAASENPQRRLYFLAGLLIGLSAIARPNILLFGAAAGVWVCVARRSEPLRGLALRVLAFAIGAALPILPVTLANASAGDFVVIASQGGVNFYIGNNPQSDGLAAVVPGARTDWWGGYYDTIAMAEEDRGRSLKPSEVSRYWYDRGLEFIRTRPGPAARLFLRKLYLFWNHREFGNNQDIYFIQERSAVLRWLSPLGFGLVAPLGLLGMGLAWRLVRASRILSLFVLVYMASVVLFFVNARYRLPVVPILLLFAAYAAVSWVDRLRAHDFAPAAGMLVAAVLFAVAVDSNFHGLQKVNRSLGHYNLGLTYLNTGHFGRAVDEFREALRADPERRDAAFNLATTLIRTGQPEEARHVLQDLLLRHPDDAEIHYAMGNALASMGDPEGALAELAKAVSLRPDYFEAYHSLGVVQYRQGRLDEAEASFRRAVEIHPRFAAAYNNLGIVLARRGNVEAAREMFEQALRIDPAHEGARENLEKLSEKPKAP